MNVRKVLHALASPSLPRTMFRAHRLAAAVSALPKARILLTTPITRLPPPQPLLALLRGQKVVGYSTQGDNAAGSVNITPRTSPHSQERRSTPTGGSEPPKSAGSHKSHVVLAALAAGLLGYVTARSEVLGSSVPAVEKHPRYGTPEDFQKAIRELQETFCPEEKEPGDIVSTNPDVLYDHGFSALVYHEGRHAFYV